MKIDANHYRAMQRYARNQLPNWLKATFAWVLQMVLRPAHPQGFVLTKRWIVECIFARLARYRRRAMDRERNPETSEAIIYIAMISLMSRLLVRKG